ncbi:MAG TPA: acyltransferase [Gemmatimonadaceae bacterium]|nr:acyltransferase [Gemmatimonadaceae bacterium]
MKRTILPERNLDVLRAIAVMLVFANHIMNALIGHISPLAAWLGRAGVQAFFVHTSLVLMGSMEKDDAPNRHGWVKRFYVRRALRIYPLAIAVIALVLLLRVPSRTVYGTTETFTLGEIIANFALAQDLFGARFVLGVLWTLPLELQMYVAIPLCYLIARKPQVRWMAVMLLIGLAMPIIGERGRDTIPGVWRLGVLGFVPCFLAGVFAYWLLRRARPVALPSWLWVPIIFADLVFGYFAYDLWTESWMVRAVFCAILGLAIPFVLELRETIFTRIAHTIATYSYGIYLLHPIALWFGFAVLREQSTVVRVLGVAASLTIGCLAAYHLIEKPGIKLGRSIFHQRVPVDAEPSAP